eukprot:scaffold23478_cov107-Cylindrotheca_fusiformis.AAC.2
MVLYVCVCVRVGRVGSGNNWVSDRRSVVRTNTNALFGIVVSRTVVRKRTDANAQEKQNNKELQLCCDPFNQEKAIYNKNKEGKTHKMSLKRKRTSQLSNDSSSSSNDSNQKEDYSSGSSSMMMMRLISIEEEIHLMEHSTLQALLDRRTIVNQELVRERWNIKRLLEERIELKEREQSLRVARIKHVSLQDELEQSLQKSREKLSRLVQLENDNEEKEEKEESQQKQSNEETTITAFGSHNCCSIAEPAIQQQPEHHQTTTKESDESNNTYTMRLIVDLQSYYYPKYHHHHEEERPIHAFQPSLFLPFQSSSSSSSTSSSSSSWITNIMLIYMREANYMDHAASKQQQQQEEDERSSSSSSSDVQSTSFTNTSRRTLLWNTCLDLMFLRNSSSTETKTTPAASHHLQQQEQEKEQTTTTTTTNIDPNVSLCPYELAGICADEYCPYQHTTTTKTSMSSMSSSNKRAMIIARERLPLPPLQLEDHYRISQQEKEKQKSTTSTYKNGTYFKTIRPSLVQTKEIEPMDDEMEKDDDDDDDDNDNDDDDNDGEENFMSLPEADVQDESEDDDESEEEEEEEADTGVVSAYLKDTKNNAFSFWWGEEEIYKEGLLLSSSVMDVLRYVGDINTIDNESNNKIELPKPNHNKGWIPWLGRMVDMCRISTHAGRHDISHSILDDSIVQAVENATPTTDDILETQLSVPNNNGDESVQDWIVSALLSNGIGHVVPQLHLIRNWALCSDKSPLSPFHVAFAVQSAYAILSEYCNARHQQASIDGSYDHPKNGSKTTTVLTTAAMAAIDSLMKLKDLPGTRQIDQQGRHPVEELELYLHKKDEDPSETTSKPWDFQNLSDLINWAKHTFHARSPWLRDCSNMVLEDQILKPCWTLVSSSIWKSTDESRQWKCLQGSIVLGFVILGCLEKFATSVERAKDSLNASHTAALTSLDSSIHRVLKDLSNQVSDTAPLLNLILSPLLSASVATAAFLRMYSAAQNRLEAVLVKKRQTRSIWMQYSELLWCQLVHLRMSLPTSLTSESEEGNNSGEFGYIEPSAASRKDVQRLTEMIEKLGIQLQHISLIGDNNLIRTTEWSSRSSSEVEKLEKVAVTLPSMIFDDNDEKEAPDVTAIDLDNIELKHRNNSSGMTLLFPSALPRSILLAHSCTHLSIQSCGLSKLPPSFGIDLVNLTVCI